MFTGLVEEIGIVESLRDNKDSLRIKIKCKKVIKEAQLGDSICTNGVCLTLVSLGSDYFEADVMHESIKRTNLQNCRKGSKVNLEKSLTLSTPLGGHLVTGDVDTVSKIIKLKKDGIALIYRLSIKTKYMKYLVEKGRITLDGTSLTISDMGSDWVEVSIIPHTQENVILGHKKEGEMVNIEFDLIGKYIERFLSFNSEKKIEKRSGITLEVLGKNGFL